jgi:hypothetical protein
MAKRTDFTIEPDLMKGEIDEHGAGEPDHWTFYLKVGDCVCDDYSRRSARRRMVLAVVKPQRSGPGRIHRPEWACSRAGSFQGKVRNQSRNLAEILQ